MSEGFGKLCPEATHPHVVDCGGYIEVETHSFTFGLHFAIEVRATLSQGACVVGITIYHIYEEIAIFFVQL